MNSSRALLTVMSSLALLSAGAHSASVPATFDPNASPAGGALQECSRVTPFSGVTYACAHKFEDSDGPVQDSVAEVECEDELGTVTTRIEVLNSDGKYFDWASSQGVGAVVVKGGPRANYFIYSPPASADQALFAPPVGRANRAELSHITFCWNNEEPDGPPGCYDGDGETAWAQGERYVNPGNWAMYVSYQNCADGVDLLAGQTNIAGSVQCSLHDDGQTLDMTISLNQGWRFAPKEVEESGQCKTAEGSEACLIDQNLKVQDYDNVPEGNPAPGKFKHKSDVAVDAGSTTITLPYNSYYGVHVDVIRFGEEFCPEDVATAEEL